MGMPGTSGKIHLSNYDNYMTCDYKIETVDANTTISLAFSRIDIEYSRGCLYDIMTVRIQSVNMLKWIIFNFDFKS